MAEVEAIINSRPLTYMYSDNINEALSPSHFIFGKRLLTLPDNIVYPEEIDDTPELFNKRMKYLITLQKRFWKQWSTTYLNELREHHKNRESTSVCREIQEGELVTVQEDNLPRGQWKMGVIQRTLRGEDGVVRGAEIKVVTKSGKMSLLRRPVTKLCPLELRSTFTDSNGTRNDNKLKTFEDKERENNVATRPPRRQAAVQGELIRRIVNSDELRGECDES